MANFKFTFENDDGETEEVEIPGRWEICDSCHGEGVHDPEGFSGGFTADDFAEDPDFGEDYRRGFYDVRCEECGGSGKVMVPDTDLLTAEQRQKFEAWSDGESTRLQEECWERRNRARGIQY